VCVLAFREWWGTSARLLAAVGAPVEGFLGEGGIKPKVPTLFYADFAARFAPSPRRATSLSRKDSPPQPSTTGVQEIQRRFDLAVDGVGQIPPQELRTYARQ